MPKKVWTASAMGEKGGYAGVGKRPLLTERAKAMAAARWKKYREAKQKEEKSS